MVKAWFGRLQKRAKLDTKSDQKLDRNLHRNFNDFLKVFGVILEGFWEHCGSQNAIKNRVKIWMRFWRPKRERYPVPGARLGGMRGGIGEDNGGVREPISAENRGREPRAGARISRLRYLARRPRWGGGSLRAFRRARVNST